MFMIAHGNNFACYIIAHNVLRKGDVMVVSL